MDLTAVPVNSDKTITRFIGMPCVLQGSEIYKTCIVKIAREHIDIEQVAPSLVHVLIHLEIITRVD